jgi:hypothetical protein
MLQKETPLFYRRLFAAQPRCETGGQGRLALETNIILVGQQGDAHNSDGERLCITLEIQGFALPQ